MSKKKAIANIKEIIQEQIRNPLLNVTFLVDILELSHSYLKEETWLQYNMSPHQLIESIKLEISIELIASNNSNLYQITKHAGYSSPRTFRRAFKNRLSITPSECKKKLINVRDKDDLIAALKCAIWSKNKEKFR